MTGGWFLIDPVAGIGLLAIAVLHAIALSFLIVSQGSDMLRDVVSSFAASENKLLQRIALATLALLLALGTSLAQQTGAFVGQWQGTVDGVGEARIVITGVKADGRVEGRMEFALQGHVAIFADKSHPVQNTSVGVVSGSTLTIEAALGGTYRLTLSGDTLAGSYTRGTTFAGKAAFHRL